MKTAGTRGNAARMYARFLAIATLLLFASISSALGQRSEDRDNPTPLNTKQLSDQLDGSEDEYFYQFSAGPGKLTVTFEVKAAGTNAGAYLDLFDANSRPVLSNVLAQGVDGSSERVVESAQLSKRQTMVMRIKGIKYGSSGGRGTYKILLNGAVTFAPAKTAESKSDETESQSDDANETTSPAKTSGGKSEEPESQSDDANETTSPAKAPESKSEEPEAQSDDPNDTTSFAGTWHTVVGTGNRFELRLKQEGNKVTGAYIPFNGRIEGTVLGSTLSFKWTQDGGISGNGNFSMIKGDQSFRGGFRTSGHPNAAETPWNGSRAPVSFAGVWNVVFGSKVSTLILVQTAGQFGDRIGGTLQSVTKDAANPLEEGSIEGNTLHFKLRTNTGRLSGLLVMDKGGKSFKGSIGPSKVTGTFVKAVPANL